MTTHHWKYRAYDSNLIIVEGVLKTTLSTPPQVLLHIRQSGLQCIDVRKIDAAEYFREDYLQRLRNRLQQPVDLPTTRTSLWAKIRAILFGRK